MKQSAVDDIQKINVHDNEILSLKHIFLASGTPKTGMSKWCFSNLNHCCQCFVLLHPAAGYH